MQILNERIIKHYRVTCDACLKGEVTVGLEDDLKATSKGRCDYCGTYTALGYDGNGAVVVQETFPMHVGFVTGVSLIYVGEGDSRVYMLIEDYYQSDKTHEHNQSFKRFHIEENTSAVNVIPVKSIFSTNAFSDTDEQLYLDDNVIKFVGIISLKEIHETFPDIYPLFGRNGKCGSEYPDIVDLISKRSNFDIRKGVFTIPIPE